MDPPSYMKNGNCYKARTLGGVTGIFQDLKKSQVDITAVVWLPWQPLNHLLLFCHSLRKRYQKQPNFK